MPEFLDRILGREPVKKTGTMAKERLQFILVHDRINLPPERMEAMKREILEVIAKYVSVDNENVEIALQKRERSSLLVAEIPFLKTLEGIEHDDDDDERPALDMRIPLDTPPAIDEQPVPEPKPAPVDETPTISEQPAVDDTATPTNVPKRKR